jgi:hypothetical protein
MRRDEFLKPAALAAAGPCPCRRRCTNVKMMIPATRAAAGTTGRALGKALTDAKGGQRHL